MTAPAHVPQTSVRAIGPSRPSARPPARPNPARPGSPSAFAQALAQVNARNQALRNQIGLSAASASPASPAAAPWSGLPPLVAPADGLPLRLQAAAARYAQPVPSSDGAPPSTILQLPGGFGPIVEQAARKYGVDPALIAAVIETESQFNPDAISRAGARGLMQLMPATARGLGVTDASDPLQNVLGGAKLLGQLAEKYRGNLELTLAAYNAGSGAVDKHGGIPPYPETQKYVPLVLAAYERFRAQTGAPTQARTATPAAGR